MRMLNKSLTESVFVALREEFNNEVLNYMWDNDIIIGAEYDHPEEYGPEHWNSLYKDALKKAKKDKNNKMVELIKPLLKEATDEEISKLKIELNSRADDLGINLSNEDLDKLAKGIKDKGFFISNDIFTDDDDEYEWEQINMFLDNEIRDYANEYLEDTEAKNQAEDRALDYERHGRGSDEQYKKDLEVVNERYFPGSEERYFCNKCGLAFNEDQLTSTDDDGNDLCPACGSKDIVDTGVNESVELNKMDWKDGLDGFTYYTDKDKYIYAKNKDSGRLYLCTDDGDPEQEIEDDSNYIIKESVSEYESIGSIEEIDGKQYYVAGKSFNGSCYKDANAYNNEPDKVCYITEGGFEAGEDWKLSVDYVETNKDELIRQGGISTRNSILDEVRTIFEREEYYYEYDDGTRVEAKDFDEKLIEEIADDAFSMVDWQTVNGFLYERDWTEAIEEFYEKGTIKESLKESSEEHKKSPIRKYTAYVFNWVNDHGYSKEFKKVWDKYSAPEYDGMTTEEIMQLVFDELADENGFNGELFVSPAEFYNNEAALSESIEDDIWKNIQDVKYEPDAEKKTYTVDDFDTLEDAIKEVKRVKGIDYFTKEEWENIDPDDMNSCNYYIKDIVDNVLNESTNLDKFKRLYKKRITESIKLKEAKENNKVFYFIVGICLDENRPDADVNDFYDMPDFGIPYKLMDENMGVCKTAEEAVGYVENYVSSGVPGTFGAVIAEDEPFEGFTDSISGGYSDALEPSDIYNFKSVGGELIYCAYSTNDHIKTLQDTVYQYVDVGYMIPVKAVSGINRLCSFVSDKDNRELFNSDGIDEELVDLVKGVQSKIMKYKSKEALLKDLKYIVKFVNDNKEYFHDSINEEIIDDLNSIIGSVNGTITESAKTKKGKKNKKEEKRVIMQQGNVTCFKESSNKYLVFENKNDNEKEYKDQESAMQDFMNRVGVNPEDELNEK